MANPQVLYAEDEITNRRLLQIQLQRNGISCDLASDGNQAMELYHKHPYDVIILDQYMPGMNGDQVAREILKDNPRAILIAITSDDAEIQSLEQAGFREVFIKPLRGKEYIEIIKSYL